MARVQRYELDDPDIDLSPAIAPDPLDLRVSLASIIHEADSLTRRLTVMAAVDFPVNDVSMFLVVNQLSYRGAMRPSELAEALGTGRANLSKIAHRLDEAGLIVRVREPSDERGVLLALTPRGREIGERIMTHGQQYVDTMLADWSEEDMTTLKRLLSRLARDAMGMRQAPRKQIEPNPHR